MISLLSKMKLKGTMQFPLAGSQNEDDFYKESQFTQDFKTKAGRNLIFSQPRKYKFYIGLADYDGNIFDETEHTIDIALTKAELTQVIKQMVAELILEYEHNQEIDLSLSHIRIEL